MNDAGSQKTDLAIRHAEWRLSRVYRKAAKDIEKLMESWAKDYEQQEKLLRKRLEEGKITQRNFDAWMRGKVFKGSKWEQKLKQIQRILLKADQHGINIIKDGKAIVFAENANFILRDIDRKMEDGRES